jgi:hypothetical protein
MKLVYRLTRIKDSIYLKITLSGQMDFSILSNFRRGHYSLCRNVLAACKKLLITSNVPISGKGDKTDCST